MYENFVKLIREADVFRLTNVNFLAHNIVGWTAFCSPELTNKHKESKAFVMPDGAVEIRHDPLEVALSLM
jgi:hypothetical protein